MSEREYFLGHDPSEWDRLEHQHALWADSLLGPLRELALPRTARILEVGAGPGALLAALAALTDVRLGAIERDPEAGRRAQARLGARAEVVVGDLYDVELAGPWDLIVARWVFSFLPDPRRVLERLVGALAPGGWVAVQDYDHDALGVWPKQPEIDRVIEAFRAAYRVHGGDLWIGAKLPQLFAELGAKTRVVPCVRAGQVGDQVWTWVERFLMGHMQNVVEQGLLSEAERDAFFAAWERQRRTPGATLITPIQVSVIAQKPEA